MEIIRSKNSMPDGTAALPGFFLASDYTTGFWGSSSNLLFTRSGVSQFLLSTNIFRLTSSVAFGWSSGNADASTQDTILKRHAGDTLAMSRTTNSQSFRLNTDSDTEALVLFKTNGGEAKIFTDSNRSLRLGINNDVQLEFSSTSVLRPVTDNGVNSGDAAHRWSNIFGVLGSISSKLYINDDADANVTIGLVINQGGNDNAIFTLKSSDVAHGMTSLAETDTYFLIQKTDPGNGGAQLVGHSAGTTGIVIHGRHTTDDTTKTSSSRGAVRVIGALKTGTTNTGQAANANIATIENDGSTRFIFDADGDSHQDVGTAWTNFDDHDDAALLTVLAHEVARPDNGIKEEFRDWLKYNRAYLEKHKLVTFNKDGHHFVNMSKLSMLHTGAIRQLALKISTLERKLIA
jgi:hypothetical protein